MAALLGTSTVAMAAPQRAAAPVSGETSELRGEAGGLVGALIAAAIVAILVLLAMELDDDAKSP
ncbi:MAG: hypothetical protein ACEQR8_12090 [Cypionkella sp.]